MFIILDNGHGIRTRGKRSPVQPDSSQLFEWEFNRDVVRRIARLLTIDDIPHIILVPQIEDMPLAERVSRANEIYKETPGSFLVSVHANAGGGTGWEVWTSPGETESDLIADIFYEQARKELGDEFRMRTDTADGDYDKEAHFYILQHTICPAVLTENLFMDSPQDLDFIMSDDGRQRIAQLHYKAILEYLKIAPQL